MRNNTKTNTCSRLKSKVKRLRAQLQKARQMADHWRGCYEITCNTEKTLMAYSEKLEGKLKAMTEEAATWCRKYEAAKAEQAYIEELQAYIQFLETFVRYTHDQETVKRMRKLRKKEVALYQ